MLLALAQDVSAPPLCEAHFFPTDQVQGFTSLGNFGLISELLAGRDVPEAELLSQIEAGSQFDIARTLLAREGRLAGFAFIEHEEPVDYHTAARQRSRLTGSDTACYVEIVVNYIAFSDSAISKQKVGVHFIARDFRERPDRPTIHKLGGSALLEPYLGESTDGEATTTVDFRGAYTEAFGAAIDRFWRPYHARVEREIEQREPKMLFTIHSFTPQLRSKPDQERPWECGILYNEDERAPRIAIPLLEAEGLTVGDNEPYSGKLLNATMNHHAEARGLPYLAIEVRNDLIGDAAGVSKWADILAPVIAETRDTLP
ncbi:N-formylglutamate amidohydrolase [uncultured Parasphingopyxis sp.]|uniref:N-formylglutamate amidohydrolase n=1 Tax=uncultured Parasphingopyxis sp. TaxID=1547918 RepID=UPI002623CC36|nr:N-formylglutamate amidohydrolase [uncultured Parasphingopyxis sp.]